MTTITINKCVYNIRPIYDLYAGSEDGTIIHILKRVPYKGNKDGNGYLSCMVRKHAQPGQKYYKVNRFIWECFNGVIPEGKVIDHINDNKEDNRSCNLQLLTPKENSKKAASGRDYTFFANRNNRKCVKAVNKNTNEVPCYYSMYAVQQHLKIHADSVLRVCEGINYRKSAVSKKDGHSYTFEYIKKEDLPDNHIKSKNIRPKRVSDEDKKKRRLEWWNKEYKCPNCEKVIKNNSKYKHIKSCNSQQ